MSTRSVHMTVCGPCLRGSDERREQRGAPRQSTNDVCRFDQKLCSLPPWLCGAVSGCAICKSVAVDASGRLDQQTGEVLKLRTPLLNCVGVQSSPHFSCRMTRYQYWSWWI